MGLKKKYINQMLTGTRKVDVFPICDWKSISSSSCWFKYILNWMSLMMSNEEKGADSRIKYQAMVIMEMMDMVVVDWWR